MLEGLDRSLAGPTAPAHGLTLLEIGISISLSKEEDYMFEIFTDLYSINDTLYLGLILAVVLGE